MVTQGRPVSWVSMCGDLYGYSGEVCELGEYVWRSLWLQREVCELGEYVWRSLWLQQGGETLLMPFICVKVWPKQTPNT